MADNANVIDMTPTPGEYQRIAARLLCQLAADWPKRRRASNLTILRSYVETAAYLRAAGHTAAYNALMADLEGQLTDAKRDGCK